MRITLIAAVAKNGAIGYQNQLLYHIPEDMKRFKDLTTGHTLVMGRKTFESLPNGALPYRRNMVVSKTKKKLKGCEVYPSLEELFQHCEQEEEIFVIGGESIYRQTIDLAYRLCITEIDNIPQMADTYFPTLTGWKINKKE